MKDDKKVKKIMFIGLFIAAALIAIVSYSIGGIGKVPKEQMQKEVSKSKTVDLKHAKVTDQAVTQNDIKSFLVAYYTKKDLEENRNRYKPFMTDSMYKTATTAEEAPVAQTYKGYVINQKFKDAKIYIDDENKIAIVKVDYSYVTLTKKTDKAADGISSSSTATLRLTYQKSDKKFLVNNVENISFDDNVASSNSTTGGITGQESIYEQPVQSTTESDAKKSSGDMPTTEERLGKTTESVEKPKTDEEK